MQKEYVVLFEGELLVLTLGIYFLCIFQKIKNEFQFPPTTSVFEDASLSAQEQIKWNDMKSVAHCKKQAEIKL